MSRAADFARVGRLQTAAMEMGGLTLAAYIGGAPVAWLPYVAVLALIIHAGGFGMNSASPYDLRLDRMDPAKRDHPIVAGRVSTRQAWAFVTAMLVLGFGMFGVLTWVTGTWVAWLPFVGFVVWGALYNLTGKLNKVAAGLEISTAFALAFLAFGMLWTGRASPLVWAVVVFAWTLVCFQILLAGEVKELAQSNEPNLLRRLGATVGPPMPALAGLIEDVVRGGGAVAVNKRALTGDWLLPSRAAWFLAFGLSYAKAAALGVVAYLVLGWWWGIAVAVAAYFVFGVYTVALLRPGPFARPKRMVVMGAGEAASYLLLVLALVPALWPWLWALFVVLPVAWFVTLNRVLWSGSGSAWAPGV